MDNHTAGFVTSTVNTKHIAGVKEAMIEMRNSEVDKNKETWKYCKWNEKNCSHDSLVRHYMPYMFVM